MKASQPSCTPGLALSFLFEPGPGPGACICGAHSLGLSAIMHMSDTTVCFLDGYKIVIVAPTNRDCSANCAGQPQGRAADARERARHRHHLPARGGACGRLLGPGDRHISYLPLAHIFERSSQAVMLAQVRVTRRGGGGFCNSQDYMPRTS